MLECPRMSNRKSELWQKMTSGKNFILLAGPCVIESQEVCKQIASHLKELCKELDILYVFKASFDKANRTAASSFRGPGMKDGLKILEHIAAEYDVPLTSDIHAPEQADALSQVLDILQVPAFLCRQTDLIQAAARTDCIVNFKKGQFLSPQEMSRVAEKALEVGNKRLMLTERGTTFGYNNLVVDMRSIPIMKKTGYPVIFDATHSVQLPGGQGDRSGGEREFAPVLAQAAVAAGADGLFIETHLDPDKALSDGPNMIRLDKMRETLERALNIWKLQK
jgi:2-dehydro-3-deoxyphosphooctonate aldolase (KDO 8-P synthase)